jgi:hypothetical protein
MRNHGSVHSDIQCNRAGTGKFRCDWHQQMRPMRRCCSEHIELPKVALSATVSTASGAHDQDIFAAVGERQRFRLSTNVSIEVALTHSINGDHN